MHNSQNLSFHTSRKGLCAGLKLLCAVRRSAQNIVSIIPVKRTLWPDGRQTHHVKNILARYVVVIFDDFARTYYRAGQQYL